jgi:hypothetical protein
MGSIPFWSIHREFHRLLSRPYRSQGRRAIFPGPDPGNHRNAIQTLGYFEGWDWKKYRFEFGLEKKIDKLTDQLESRMKLMGF